MPSHYILMGLFFSLVPALVVAGILWLFSYKLVVIGLIAAVIFLFGLDICFRGKQDGK